MKPRPTSTVSFACDTDEEKERHERGEESRRKRRRERAAAKKAKGPTTLTPPAMTAEQKSFERMHHKCTFNFFWQGDEKEIRAMLEYATKEKDDDFIDSLNAFADRLLITLPSEGGLLPRFERIKIWKVLEFILDARKNHSSFDVYDFLGREKNSEYKPQDLLATPLLRNFRKTRSFAFMICGLEYDSSLSDIDVVSPSLKQLRIATTPVIPDIVFANHFQGLKTGETTASFDHSEASHEPKSDSTMHPPPQFPPGIMRPTKVARKKSENSQSVSSAGSKSNHETLEGET